MKHIDTDEKVREELDVLEEHGATFVSEEEYEKRISECLDCEDLIKFTTQCKHCMCFMRVKARLNKNPFNDQKITCAHPENKKW